MEYSIIERLNPASKLPYICEDERGTSDFTTFFIKPLTVFEYRHCEDSGKSRQSLGSLGLKALQHGLVGWDNFLDEDEKIIPFDLANFSHIPYYAQLEIANAVMDIADLTSDLQEEIRITIKFNDWSSKKNTGYQWDCEYCLENKLDVKRNCDGTLPRKCVKCGNLTLEEVCEKCSNKTKSQFMLRFSNFKDDYTERCPVALMTERAVKLVNLINFMENAKSLPFQGGALEQTYFFYTARLIVLSEQDSILRRELDIKTKTPNKLGGGNNPWQGKHRNAK